MSDNNNNQTSAGLNSLLFITFLILKLTNVIDWSWWWVTSPLWIPFALAFMLVVIYMILNK